MSTTSPQIILPNNYPKHFSKIGGNISKPRSGIIPSVYWSSPDPNLLEKCSYYSSNTNEDDQYDWVWLTIVHHDIRSDDLVVIHEQLGYRPDLNGPSGLGKFRYELVRGNGLSIQEPMDLESILQNFQKSPQGLTSLRSASCGDVTFLWSMSSEQNQIVTCMDVLNYKIQGFRTDIIYEDSSYDGDTENRYQITLLGPSFENEPCKVLHMFEKREIFDVAMVLEKKFHNENQLLNLRHYLREEYQCAFEDELMHLPPNEPVPIAPTPSNNSTRMSDTAHSVQPRTTRIPVSTEGSTGAGNGHQVTLIAEAAAATLATNEGTLTPSTIRSLQGSLQETIANLDPEVAAGIPGLGSPGYLVEVFMEVPESMANMSITDAFSQLSANGSLDNIRVHSIDDSRSPMVQRPPEPSVTSPSATVTEAPQVTRESINQNEDNASNQSESTRRNTVETFGTFLRSMMNSGLQNTPSTERSTLIPDTSTTPTHCQENSPTSSSSSSASSPSTSNNVPGNEHTILNDGDAQHGTSNANDSSSDENRTNSPNNYQSLLNSMRDPIMDIVNMMMTSSTTNSSRDGGDDGTTNISSGGTIADFRREIVDELLDPVTDCSRSNHNDGHCDEGSDDSLYQQAPNTPENTLDQCQTSSFEQPPSDRLSIDDLTEESSCSFSMPELEQCTAVLPEQEDESSVMPELELCETSDNGDEDMNRVNDNRRNYDVKGNDNDDTNHNDNCENIKGEIEDLLHQISSLMVPAESSRDNTGSMSTVNDDYQPPINEYILNRTDGNVDSITPIRENDIYTSALAWPPYNDVESAKTQSSELSSSDTDLLVNSLDIDEDASDDSILKSTDN